MKHKLLVVTYYWPPSGGAGVQRWLQFVKYLSEIGWDITVYTPLNPEAPAEDPTLLDEIPGHIEVIKTRIWEPYTWYKKITGKKGKIQAGFLSENPQRRKLPERLSLWSRSNLFVPDARKFWIKPSIRYLRAYLRKDPAQVVITTGPPHSMHIIGLELKKQTGIPWVADFRDPWTGIDYYKDLLLTRWADSKHHRLEREVLLTADKVVSVGKTMAREWERLSGRTIDVIHNGYDPVLTDEAALARQDTFTLTHIGSINKDRNHESLWKALRELCEGDPGFYNKLRIRLVGKTDYAVSQALKKQGLEDKLERSDYLPHERAVLEQRKADGLLLLINNTPGSKGILTGKLFEYIASGRPILAVGDPEGEAQEILRKTQTGTMFHFSDKNGIRDAIRQLFDGTFPHFNPQKMEIEKYSRAQLAADYDQVLRKLI